MQQSMLSEWELTATRIGLMFNPLIAGKLAMKSAGSRSMRVLFVCMGNICRSPTAEAVFRDYVRRHAPGLDIEIDSAGTHDYHVGASPDPRAIKAAARRGIDLTALRARQVDADDFERFDLILALDRLNHATLLERSQPRHHPRIRTLLEFVAGRGHDVPDPYYGGAEGFDEVLDLVAAAAPGLLAEIRRRPTVP
jgi:protein-tyrosine phosphatase